MKSYNSHLRNFLHINILSAFCAASVVTLGVDVYTDNFDDGNDVEWTHFGLESIGLPPPSYEFPDDIFSGKAYRIATPAPPIPDAGPGRAFSYLADHTLSEFLIEADLLDWDSELNQAFGFLIRAENIGLGLTTGYVVNYDPQQESGGRGQFQINRVVGEASDETIASGNITLQPGENYRIVAAGIGPDLYAAIYSLRDLTEPIVVISAMDETFTSGVFGLFNFSRVDADEYTSNEVGRSDSTFDNFRLSDDPFEAVEPFLGFFIYSAKPSIPGQPFFLGKIPGALAPYTRADFGLSFGVVPSDDNSINIDSTKLVLNGRDVSSELSYSQEDDIWDFVYDNLASNRVYHAYAEVAAENGQKSSIDWTFDTFVEGDQESGDLIVIEAEDYNYGGGQYQNDPPISGFTINFLQVRGDGDGYLDLVGVPGVDYFDFSEQPGGGIAPEYRLDDNVGTQIGALEIEPGFLINDWNREKYLTEELEEYQVRRTEGGEWLNYTRDFPEGNYEVYLRAASRAEQIVFLDRVTSSTSAENQTKESIGQFNLPNDGLNIRYSFTQLVDENGQPLIIHMSDQETVRLTIGGEREDRTQYTAVLNYLVFSPVKNGPEIQLLSANSLDGEFTPETEAILSSEELTFTVPMTSSEKYYRIQDEVTTRIETIRVENGSLILVYSIE